MIQQVLTALRMTPTLDAVSLPFVRTLFSDGNFAPNDASNAAAKAMLDELVTTSRALARLPG